MSHKLTRRALLGGGSAAILTAAIPAAAKPPALRGGRQRPSSGSRSPLALTLTFAGGATATFSEVDGTIADLSNYAGIGFTQKCLRHRATGYGDYRDGFTVFFRPDTDGLRDELIVEYLTEYNFSTTGANTTRASAPLRHLFMPLAPTLTKTSGGPTGQSGTLIVYLTYIKTDGETTSSYFSSISPMTTNDQFIVTSPAAIADVTHYNIYGYIGGGIAYKLNTSPVLIGTNWTSPSSGLPTSGTIMPDDSTTIAYTATITGGNLVSPVVYNINRQFAHTRWRYQSAPRPLIRSYASLLAAKAIFPMTTALAFGASLPPADTWEGPLGTGGINTSFGDTAEHPDIGPMTEWQAAWLLTGSSAMETAWRAGAEAVGSMPFWIRDAATGTFVDTTSYPYLAYGTSNALGVAKYTIPTLPSGSAPNSFSLDVSHMPPMSFLPAMLTDDPYFWEGLMQETHWSVQNSNGIASTNSLPNMVFVAGGQARGTAWSLRQLFQSAAFTPVSPPGWLKPRSYWSNLLVNSRTYAGKYLSATASPATTVFGMFPITGALSSFMHDYVTIILQWAKYTGYFPEWDVIAEYESQRRRAFGDTGNAFGWDNRYPSPYNFPLSTANLGAAAVANFNTTWDIAFSVNTPSSWSQWFDDFKAWAPSHGAYTAPEVLGPDSISGTSLYYLPYARAALAAIALSGTSQDLANHALLKSRMDLLTTSALSPSWKWAIAPP